MTGSRSLFFYGTLVHPSILARVIGNDGAHLTTDDAILEGHTRHHVVGEDYPAVVAASAGKAIMGRELTAEEGRVQGSLVSGLTDKDVALLDEFEGNEYTRSSVTVTLSSETAQGEVYLWSDPLSRLSASIWTFEEFLRESAHRWVGAEGEKRGEYAEVDRRRAMGGFITPTGVREVEQKALRAEKEYEPFGKSLREKYWTFEKGWVNLNHGSYGSAPKPVIDACRAISERSEAAPDRFMRLEYMEQLKDARRRLAEFVHCDTDDLVVVNNATTGVNDVLRSLTNSWEKGDKLLYYSTTIYNACSASLQYIVDTHPHLNLSLVPVQLAYPVSHADVLEATRKAIDEANAAGGGKVRLGFFDAISSNPGVVVPWEELVKLCRSKGVLSLVDAAHQIGQLPVNLRASQPDFWVSNCHKWLLAHRSCAVLYIAKEHQHLIHAVPTGHYYRKREGPSPNGEPAWVPEFEWNGTIDFSPFLATAAALDFRRDVLGGEDRINAYCHKLAIDGGELTAKVLGTETMRNKEGEGELVAHMINVRLPIDVPPSSFSADEKTKLVEFFFSTQALEHKTTVPIWVHRDLWWTRLSAQVYNDLADFEYVAEVLKSVCKRVNEGEHRGEKLPTEEEKVALEVDA
ncbi:pyridoxal phosphate-dependent transferase [Leucosporidium creatinivorum]|uniref:Pyridoxal phosphate-dependent transferase n=1 Tax=Leucosporidium creatinivorum TaxID=106004 RepID=A0A1Y2DC18_9BASI|nr:pyridoxal phosphate-dependent transferase [Leucosporidium creatinivorum]